MKETEYQKVVVDAVRGAHGWGIKMSNRFLVGIPDLLIQMPTYPTTMLEAKYNAWPLRPDTTIKPGVTALQAKNLKEADRAGMLTGVICFARSQSKNWHGVAIVVYEDDLTLTQDQYAWSTRSVLPVTILKQLADFWGKHG